MSQDATVTDVSIGLGLHKQLTYTLVFRDSSRAGKVLEKQFGADVLKNITAVTDRHPAYFALDFKDHQICLAHILRELQYLTELDPNQDWSKKIEELLKEAIHKRNENPSKKMDASPWLKKLDDLLKLSLGHLKKDFDRLRNGMNYPAASGRGI